MSEYSEVMLGIEAELSKLETWEMEAAVLARKIERSRRKLSELCEKLSKWVVE